MARFFSPIPHVRRTFIDAIIATDGPKNPRCQVGSELGFPCNQKGSCCGPWVLPSFCRQLLPTGLLATTSLEAIWCASCSTRMPCSASIFTSLPTSSLLVTVVGTLANSIAPGLICNNQEYGLE